MKFVLCFALLRLGNYFGLADGSEFCNESYRKRQPWCLY